jgi:hypothetical protein
VTRELLRGKLTGLWGAASDADAFDSWPLDKKQALLLLLDRMQSKQLWHLVKRVTNVYGEGGVGLQFEAWPMIESTLSRRHDFTRRFANPRTWYVHFDLYSPINSPGSAWRHLRHEMLSKVKPDWRTIAKSLNT